MRISGLRVRTIYIKEDFQRVDSNQLRVYSVRKYAFNLESCASIIKILVSSRNCSTAGPLSEGNVVAPRRQRGLLTGRIMRVLLNRIRTLLNRVREAFYRILTKFSTVPPLQYIFLAIARHFSLDAHYAHHQVWKLFPTSRHHYNVSYTTT